MWKESGPEGWVWSSGREDPHTLECHGPRNLSLQETGLTEEELLRWYFESRPGRPVPADLTQYSRLAGFENRDAFCRAVVREFCYCVQMH